MCVLAQAAHSQVQANALLEMLTFCMTTAPLVPELLAMSRNGEPNALLYAEEPSQLPVDDHRDHALAELPAGTWNHKTVTV